MKNGKLNKFGYSDRLGNNCYCTSIRIPLCSFFLSSSCPNGCDGIYLHGIDWDETVRMKQIVQINLAPFSLRHSKHILTKQLPT